MGGVVDQWRWSHHSHPQENEVGTGACGNCHGIDGIAQRVANNYVVAADAGPANNVAQGHISYRAANGVAVNEIGYGGATTIGAIHCTTCHDFNPTTDPHVVGSYAPGQAPIRVSLETNAYIEASPAGAVQPEGTAVSMGRGNLCVYCHKSRKDVTHYITAANNVITSRWGPHQGPQADIYSGKGGYHFVGQVYGNSTHQTLSDGCVTCHMQPNADNGGVPDHSMKPKLDRCVSAPCHTQYQGKTFDILSGQSTVKRALAELQALLNAEGMLTRSSGAPYAELQPEELGDGQYHLDSPRQGGAPGGGNHSLNAARAGALYNYLVIARGRDYGVHNPLYVKQLLWDSIREIKGSASTVLGSVRPQ